MSIDSLSVFSRVRLYTAIYPQGDVVDITENFSTRSTEDLIEFPVLSLRELSIKPLPSVNPLRYQSPIALFLGAQLKIAPKSIARTICQESLAEDGLQLSYDDRGWITLTWDEAKMLEILREVSHSFKENHQLSIALGDCPFWLWQLRERSRSLMDDLRLLHPSCESPEMNNCGSWPVPLQDLLEAVVRFFDRLSLFDRPTDQTVIKEYQTLKAAFERLHQKVPVFSPQISRVERSAVLLVLECFQGILEGLKID
jgi:hypothetical protein